MKQIITLALLCVLAACGGGGGGSDSSPSTSSAVVSAWDIERAQGTPDHLLPHAEGEYFDFPHPTAERGRVGYVTKPTGPLSAATKVTLRVRIEAAPGVVLVPTRFPGSPALLTLYFQRAGDDWTARGDMEAYRWYASFATVQNIGAGEYELVARFDQNWTAVLRSSRSNNPAGFQAALDHAERIGFVLGGGDGLGHGVYATGPARLVVTSFQVE